MVDLAHAAIGNPVHATAGQPGRGIEISRVRDGVAGTPEKVSLEQLHTVKEARCLVAAIDAIDIEGLKEVIARVERARAELSRDSVTIADTSRAKGVLSDFCATQDRVLEQTTDAMAREPLRLPLPHRLSKKQRERDWGRWIDSLMEVSNLGFDIVFLATDLWRESMALFIASAGCIGASMLARLCFGLQERHRVDWRHNKWRYVAGLLLSVIDPFWGSRSIKSAFRHDDVSGAQVWSAVQNKMVRVGRDPLAVQAANDAAAVHAEFRTCVVLVLVEDVPGFAIQLLYYAFYGDSDGGAFALDDPFFLLTVITTMLHTCKALMEAWKLRVHELPRLKLEDDRRDKTFEEGCTTDRDLVTFAKFARRKGSGIEHTRRVVLRGCTQITDAGVQALAEVCTGITTMSLEGCIEITDTGMRALAKACTGITTIDVHGCTQITDVGVRELAEACTGLTTIYLGGCNQITDAGVRALAEACTGINSVGLFGCPRVSEAILLALRERGVELTGLRVERGAVMLPPPEPVPLPCNLSVPGLVLVAKGSARQLVFEHTDALRQHREVPLTLASHPGQAIVPRSSSPSAYPHGNGVWLIVELGVGVPGAHVGDVRGQAPNDAVSACRCVLDEEGFIVHPHDGRVFDVDGWRYAEENGVNLINDVRSVAHTREAGGGRSFELNDDGTISLCKAPHLVLGMARDRPQFV